MMIRSLMIAVAFLAVSPALRNRMFEILGQASEQVNLHGALAMTLSGLLVFGTFLGIQLTARK